MLTTQRRQIVGRLFYPERQCPFDHGEPLQVVDLALPSCRTALALRCTALPAGTIAGERWINPSPYPLAMSDGFDNLDDTADGMIHPAATRKSGISVGRERASDVNGS
jgi:hypothetical protein